MSEIVIPPWIVPDEEQIELVDDNSVRFEPQFGRGQSQRQSYGAPRFKISRKHTVRLSERGNILGILSALRGSQNTVRTCVHQTLRGAFGLSELVTNNNFESGTTGWTVLNTSLHKVSDRLSVLQIAAAQDGTVGDTYGIGRSLTTVQYAPYVVRVSFMKGRGVESYAAGLGLTVGTSAYALSSGATPGLLTAAGVVRDVSAAILAGGITATGNTYQDYSLCNQTSVARCALVDNGGNNLLQSDTFNTTWTLNNVTISTNVAASPDYSITDGIRETVAAGDHNINQGYTVSSAALDFTYTIGLKRGARDFAMIQIDDGTDVARCSINLLTGATLGLLDTGNMTDVRVAVQAAGNFWFIVNISARKTSSATTLNAKVFCSTDGLTFNYAGSAAADAILVFRATSKLSSCPVRQTLTTSSIVASALQSGSSLFIKGLPASTDGLSLPGDYIEINNELKRLTAPLNSDALGLGYIQFEPEMINAPVDDAPVIFFQPFGRFIISNIRERPRVSDVEVTYDLEQIYE